MVLMEKERLDGHAPTLLAVAIGSRDVRTQSITRRGVRKRFI